MRVEWQMFEDENDVMLGIPSTEKMIDSNKMKNRSKLGGIPVSYLEIL